VPPPHRTTLCCAVWYGQGQDHGPQAAQGEEEPCQEGAPPPPPRAAPRRRRRRRRRRSPRVQRFARTAATAATCPGHGCWLTVPTRSSLAGAWSQEGQDAGRCVGSCWWIAHAGEAGPQRKYHMCIRVYATANCGRSRAVITMNQKPNKVTHRSATLALALCSALVYLEHVPPCHPWHTSFSLHRSRLLHNGLASKRGRAKRTPAEPRHVCADEGAQDKGPRPGEEVRTARHVPTPPARRAARPHSRGPGPAGSSLRSQLLWLSWLQHT
jgi:hypothetical protein